MRNDELASTGIHRARRADPSVVLRLSFVILSLALAGCGGATHFKVKGKVVDGGKPVQPDPKTSIQIAFVQKTEDGKPYDIHSAVVNPDDGTFEMVGNDNAGVLVGKYKVKLSSVSLNPSPFIQLLNRKFSTDATPLVIDIVDDKTPLVIDIGPYKGK